MSTRIAVIVSACFLMVANESRATAGFMPMDKDQKTELREMYDKVFSFLETSVDSSLYYLDQMETLAHQANDPYWNAQTLFVRGSVLLQTGEISEAISLLEKAALDLLVIDARKEAAIAFDNAGQGYLRLGDHEPALKAFFRAIDIESSLEVASFLGRKYANISNAYYAMGDSINQKVYLDRALDALKFANNPRLLDELYIRSLHLQYLSAKQDYRGAKIEVVRMIEICREAGQELNVYTLTLNLASYNNGLDLPGEAKEALLSVQHLVKEDLVGAYSVASFHTRMAMTERLLGNFQEAIHHGQKALVYSDKSQNPRLISAILNNLIISCKKATQSDLAYIYYDQLMVHKDSLFDRQKLEAIAKMEAQYQLSQKNEQLALREAALAQSRLRNNHIVVAGLLLLVLILISTGLIWRRNLRLQSNEKVNLGKIKELKEQVSAILKMSYGSYNDSKGIEDMEQRLTEAIDAKDVEVIDKINSMVNQRDKRLTNGLYDPELMRILNREFLRKVSGMYPQLTNYDLRVICFLLLNPSNKELAEAMGVSLKAAEAARKRLRIRMGLGSRVDLNKYILDLQTNESMVA